MRIFRAENLLFLNLVTLSLESSTLSAFFLFTQKIVSHQVIFFFDQKHFLNYLDENFD